MSYRLIVIGYQVSNCRAGASPADPWNGKRERLPYKIRYQKSEVRVEVRACAVRSENNL